MEWVNRYEAHMSMDKADDLLPPDYPEELRERFYFDHIPTPTLAFPDRHERHDLFFLGLWFASRRLLDALGAGVDSLILKAAEVEQGPEHARAAGYYALTPLHHADAVDPERSAIRNSLDADGNAVYWNVAYPPPATPPPYVTFKPGFEPPAPVFKLIRTDWLMMTSAAARAIYEAGIETVRFLPPTGELGYPPYLSNI